MKKLRVWSILIVLSLLLVSPETFGQELRYDAEKNGVELYGPYLKYNFLAPPHTFGLSDFQKSDISLQIERKGKKLSLVAHWPSYFMKSGKISLHDSQSRRFHKDSMSSEDTKLFGSLNTYKLEVDAQEFLGKAKVGVHFCVKSKKNDGYEAEICSDKLKLSGNKLVPVRTSDKVSVLLSGVKVPVNAQIMIPPGQDILDLYVKFQSGCKIRIEEPVYRLNKKQLVVDAKASKVFIQHKSLARAESSASFGKILKKAFREKNYILEQSSKLKSYSKKIDEEDMEFSPFQEGRSLQLFALSFPEIPSQNVPVRISSSKRIGTYSSSVEIAVEAPSGVRVTDSDGKVLKDGLQNGLIWGFQTPRKGEFNRDFLNVVSESASDETKSYSAQVYRGHSGSISARAAVSSGLESLVPGYQLQADYWPEKIFSKASPFFQRWGFGVGYSEALGDFKLSDFGENLEQSSVFADLMFRFSPGVRPQRRSWGAGLRYFNLGILGGQRGDIDPSLFGVGLFWHTAPIGVIDATVNAVPFFNHPKWVEISAYYYPVSTTEEFSLEAAFSLQARGRLMFARKWFLDTSINYHYVSFRKERFGGTASVVEGSIGMGYNF